MGIVNRMNDGVRRSLALFVIMLFLLLSLSSIIMTSDRMGSSQGPSGVEGYPLNGDGPAPTAIFVVNATGLTFEQRLLLVSLQGIVNRANPQLYVDHGGPCDPLWLSRLSSSLPGVPMARLDYDAALTLFIGHARGCAIYDKREGMTVNVAASLSGLMDAVMVEKGGDDHGLAHLYDATVRNATNMDPVRFFEVFRGAANRSVLANLDPGHVETRDFLIKNRILTLDVVPGPFFESRGNKEFAGVYDLFSEGSNGRNRVAMGSFEGTTEATEDYVIQELSRRGVVLIPAQRTPNLSILSTIPGRSGPQEDGEGHRGGSTPLQRKVYLTFGMEDGDNLDFDYDLMDGLWGPGSTLQEVPISWTISPTMERLCPFYYDYYLETLPPNDTLVDATSGLGVVFPELYPEEMLRAYLDASTGTAGDIVWLANTFNPYEIRYSARVLGSYAEQTSCIILDYGDMPDRTPCWMEGQAVVVRATHFWSDMDNLRAKLDVQRASSDRPCFIFIAIYPWHFDKDTFLGYYEQLKKDPDIAIVNGTAFFDLARTSLASSSVDPPDRFTLFRSWDEPIVTGVPVWAWVAVVALVGASLAMGIRGPGRPGRHASMGRDGLELALATTIFLLGMMRAVFGNYWNWSLLLLALPAAAVFYLAGRQDPRLFSHEAGLPLLCLLAPSVLLTSLAAPFVLVAFFLVWKDRTAGVVRSLPLAILLAIVVSMTSPRYLIPVVGGLLLTSLMLRHLKIAKMDAVVPGDPRFLPQLLVPVLLLPMVLPEFFLFNGRLGFEAGSTMAVVLILPAVALILPVLSGLGTGPLRGVTWGKRMPLVVPFLLLLASGTGFAIIDVPLTSTIGLFVFYCASYLFVLGFLHADAGVRAGPRPRAAILSFLGLFVTVLFIFWSVLNPVVYPIYAGISSYWWAYLCYQRLGLIVLGAGVVASIMLAYRLRRPVSSEES
jgi:hypothetical protein